jgi:hypothetical protein
MPFVPPSRQGASKVLAFAEMLLNRSAKTQNWLVGVEPENPPMLAPLRRSMNVLSEAPFRWTP